MYERVEGLPLLLRSVAAATGDVLIKELLLSAARKIEELEGRVSHTKEMEQRDV